MSAVQRGFPFLCWVVSDGRRRRGDEEGSGPSFGGAFPEFSSGFPALDDDDSMRRFRGDSGVAVAMVPPWNKASRALPRLNGVLL
jgi:hypothetical protein